ncbi:MAG: ROK family protein [Planctomycetes bacterium]|nr:ROK family protein [Planctomycetota bacterium]
MIPKPETLVLIDIGGSQSTVALSSPDGRLMARRTLLRPEGQQADGILQSVIERIEALQAEFPESLKSVQRCGIGFGGPVAQERPLRSEHVRGWENLDPCRTLEERFGWSCRIENDGLAGALGEFHYGAGRGGRHMIYLTISTGIGGGVILDGRLYRGSRGFAGHLGHLKIGLDGPLCACGGRGCFEALCSGPSIARRARDRARARPREAAALIARAGGVESIQAKTLLECAIEGDIFSSQVVQQVGEDFGRALASIFHAFDPDRIVLGGGVAQAGETFLGVVRRETELRLLPQFRGKIDITGAGLGTDSVLFGALALALGQDEM